MDVPTLRTDFPILEREINGHPLVYFDNAATSQTPEPVLEAMNAYYRTYNSNVHRGIHQLSQEASIAYEEAHDRVAEFINAPEGRPEIVFTKNATEAMNLLASGWGRPTLGAGDEIVLTEMEHHASLVTWQQLAAETGATVRYIPITADGRLDMAAARELIGPDTAVVSVVHVSNTLGTINPVTELSALAHDHDALVVVDGAQSVPTRPVDVQALGADALVFSGHKMCGPTGIGVLWARRSLLESMAPYQYGGEMIRKVTFEAAEWNELPWKFEAGTPPIAEAIGLAAACEYLADEVGMERLAAHERRLATAAYERLSAADDIEVYGPPGPERGGLVAFNLAGVHAHDLSSIVNDYGVAIRAGDHCTQPLHDVLGVGASARASFYLYNTMAELEQLEVAIDAARDLFG